MGNGFKVWGGVLVSAVLASVPALGLDIPDEVWKLRDIAISNSTAVRISAEKLKADYKISETEETEYNATYKVTDFPKKGTHATVTYRANPQDAGKPYEEVGRPPLDKSEYKKWEALVREKRKQFPKPIPASVECMDDQAKTQTSYEFHDGVLTLYSEYVEDITKQGVFIQFHVNRQLALFVKLQNNGRTGMLYAFDEKGNLISIHDYGPAPAEPRPKVQVEGTLEINKNGNG